jgi:nucleoside-diphosphate-sugar epimerase
MSLTPSLPQTAHLLICGNGYLGQAIASAASERGFDVTTCSLSGGNGSHVCDLGSAESVAMLASMIEPPDAIVHCASSGKGGPPAYESVYRNGILHLQSAFPETLILFTSSSSVYGQTDGSIVTEDSPAVPDRETGRILLEAEALTTAANGIVCRLSGIYGPARSVLLKKFLHGEAVIEEDGRRFLNQIHRDDAATAILHLLALALENNAASRTCGETFNVTDSRPLTQREVYESMAAHFQRPLPPTGPRDENRKRGWTHKRVSNEKIRALGWQPQFPSFLEAYPGIAPTLD